MRTTFVLLCLCLLVALKVNSADSVVRVTEEPNGLHLFTTPYFAIVAPASLLWEASPNGSRLSFQVTYRQSMAAFGIDVLPLKSVNGYRTKWNDLPGYFRFIKRPLTVTRVGSYRWAYLGTENEVFIDKTFFHIHKGYFVQVSYNYPAKEQAEYGDLFESMLASVRLRK